MDGYLAELKKSPQARDAEADGRNLMEHTEMSKGYCVCAQVKMNAYQVHTLCVYVYLTKVTSTY